MGKESLTKLTVLDATAYFAEVTGKLRTAKKGERIAVTTMSFDPNEPLVADFMGALSAAAKKGAHVTLAVDAHSFMISRSGLPNGPLVRHANFHNTKNPYYKSLADALDRLQKAGGTVSVINRSHGVLSNPKAGRSHIKTVIIGDEVYLGGCNLKDTHRTDLMVHLKDASVAGYMYDLVVKIVKTGSTQTAMHLRDRELAIDGRTSLLVDSGARGQSLIFEQALELIDNADEWLVMTCQYFPYGVTARHLAAARARGVKVRLYYGNPAHQENVQIFAHRMVIMQQRARNPRELFELRVGRKQTPLHAKLIATEKGAIVGSHNFVTAGVRFGTAEAAILRRDASFARQATDTIEKQLDISVSSQKKS